MSLLQRISELVKEDLTAILPGSDTPFNSSAFYRLLLYIGLIIFAITLFFARSGTPEGKKDRRDFNPTPRDEPMTDDISPNRSI